MARSLFLIAVCMLAAAHVGAQVRLSDGEMTRFAVLPGAPTVFVYTPPVVGTGPQPFRGQDDSARWLRVNAHAQAVPLTVAVALPPKLTKTSAGLDVGVVQRLGLWTGDPECLGSGDTWQPQPPEMVTITISIPNTTTTPVNAVVMAAAFSTRPPVPGGCCTTCVQTDDPMLALASTDTNTLVAAFQQADLGVPRDDGGSPHGCNCDFVVSAADSAQPALVYSLYRSFGGSCGSSFHPDLSEDTFFSALSGFSSTAGVLSNGILHSTFSAKQIKKAHLTLRPGQIAIYNVLVSDVFQQKQQPGAAALFQAVYTPRVSYGCSMDGTGPLPPCSQLGDAASVGMSVAAAVVGVYLAIFGHRWILGELAGFGVLMFGVSAHLVLSVLVPSLAYKVHIALAGLGGLAGAAVMVVLWRLLHWSSLCIVLMGMVCGALVACVVFASPIGEYSVWQSNLGYAMCFACVSAFVPVVLLLLRRHWLSHVSSALVGTYCFFAGIDYFVGSSFSYIVLNVFNRVTVQDFAISTTGNYFGSEYNGCTNRTKNTVMFIAWLATAAICLLLQRFLTSPADIPSSREPLCGPPKNDEGEQLQPLVERAGPAPRRYHTFNARPIRTAAQEATQALNNSDE